MKLFIVLLCCFSLAISETNKHHNETYELLLRKNVPLLLNITQETQIPIIAVKLLQLTTQMIRDFNTTMVRNVFDAKNTDQSRDEKEMCQPLPPPPPQSPSSSGKINCNVVNILLCNIVYLSIKN